MAGNSQSVRPFAVHCCADLGLSLGAADGGRAIADLAVLRDQLLGSVASDPTAWRVLSDMDAAALARLRAARAQARELAWAQAAETHDGLPTSMAAGPLREGRAGSSITADHISVLDAALAQIPDAHRCGTDILIRSDSAGCTYGFLAHIRSLREHGMNATFSTPSKVCTTK